MTKRPGHLRLAVVGLVCLALALPGAWLDLRTFLACWLAAWWFVIGVSLGGLVNVWIHRLSGGRWGEALRTPALLAARRMPLALLLGLPVVLGARGLFPWAADPAGHWAREMARPAFPLWWLQPGFVALRAVLYAGLWWLLSRPGVLAVKGRSAAALVTYGLSGTLAAVDLLMSLVPGWFSTAFGLVVLSGQALGGAALCSLALAFGAPQELTRAAGPRQPPVGRDLGNLMLMWVMTWAYLAFMEFLIIWSENLPPEIRWYVPRLQTGWGGAGVLLVVTLFALPLLALLQRAVKDRPLRLAVVAGWLLAAQLLNSAWLVLPSVQPHSLMGWWAVPLLALGMGLLVWTPLAGELRAHEAVFERGEVRHGTA
jgi:hypothetical protein